MKVFGRNAKKDSDVVTPVIIEEQDEDKIQSLEAKIKNLEERIAYIEYHSYKKREYRDPKVS